MKATFGSMRSPGSVRILALLTLAIGLASCRPMSQQVDVGPDLAPAAAPCPAQLGFEPPTTLLEWDCPTWPGGFESWALDNSVAYCGYRALRIRGTYRVGGSFVVLNHLFDGPKNVQGGTLKVRVYVPQASPAGFRFLAVFLDNNLNWTTLVSKTGLAQGWNTLTLPLSGAAFQKVMGIHFEIAMMSGASTPYQTDLWIDEVSW